MLEPATEDETLPRNSESQTSVQTKSALADGYANCHQKSSCANTNSKSEVLTYSDIVVSLVVSKLDFGKRVGKRAQHRTKLKTEGENQLLKIAL